MKFHSPLFFFLIVVLIGVFFLNRKKKTPFVKFSNVKLIDFSLISVRLFFAENLDVLRFLGLCLIIIALARPQSPIEESKIEVEGIDIVLAMDCSTSMLAEDFTIGNKRVNRLEAVKDVIKEFIKKRNNDRIGIIAFAAKAYTVCPLTLDYDWLGQNLDRVDVGIIEDGTAIGSGISSSLNRIKESDAKSKIVILLTDGMNNTGAIDPIAAAEAAKVLNIKIYTIGAGTKGLAPYPAQDFFGRKVYQKVKIDIDESMLRKIASITDAKYYRATDTKSLMSIYDEIDRLEKTEIEDKGYLDYKELFPFFLLFGLICIALELLLKETWLRKLP